MHLGLEDARDNLFDMITLIACALNIEFCSNANDVVFKSYTPDREHSRTDYPKYTLKCWIHSQQIRLKATHSEALVMLTLSVLAAKPAGDGDGIRSCSDDKEVQVWVVFVVKVVMVSTFTSYL